MTDYQLGYDTQDLPGFSSVPAPVAQTGADPWARMGAVYEASKRSQWYTGATNSQDVALQDAAAKRITTIQQATGVQLANPYRASPFTGDELQDPLAHPDDKAALQAFARDHADIYRPGQILDAGAQIKAAPYRVQQFKNRLQDLAGQFPEHAETIGADRPIDQDAAALARGAAQDASQAYAAGPGGGMSFAASLAGGLVASFRDPYQVAGLFVGGGEVKATSLFGSMVEGGVRQGAVNAGIAALEQPGVQAWRKQIGLESGVAPAAEDVGLAALFGFIPGMGVTGASRALRARQLARASQGDRASAEALVKDIPPAAAPELHAVVASDTLDRQAAPPVPDGVKPDHAAQAYREAVRFGEDPLNDPLPEFPPVSKPGVTDQAAIKAIDDARVRSPEAAGDPYHVVDVLRSDPALLESALSSVRPDLTRAGRLASLSDAALALVKAGEVDAGQASHVPGMVGNPVEQAAMLDAIKAFRPVSEERARKVVSDALDNKSMPNAQASILKVEAVHAAIPSASTRIDVPSDIAAHGEALKGELVASAKSRRSPAQSKPPAEQSFFHFLASMGGLEDSADLRHMLGGHNPFVPGQGRLIRKKGGMDLDSAWRAAMVDGFIQDARHSGDAHQWTSGIPELLNLIDAEARGQRQFRIGMAPEKAFDAGRETHEMLGALDHGLETSGISAASIDADTKTRTVEVMKRDKISDPLVAFERAIMEEVEQRELVQQGRIDETGQIPGWDHPIAETPSRTERVSADADGTAEPGGTASRSTGSEPGRQGALRAAGDVSRDAGDGAGAAAAKPELIDRVPIADRVDGSDLRLLTHDELLTERPREELLAHLVKDCAL